MPAIFRLAPKNHRIEKGKSSSIHLHFFGFHVTEKTNCKSAIQLIGRSKEGICTEKFEQCQ